MYRGVHLIMVFTICDLVMTHFIRYYQERIMRKNVRGEECDTTTHLIEIVFLLTLVVLLNLARVFQNRDRERWSCDLYSLGMKLFPHLLDSKATWRLLESF